MPVDLSFSLLRVSSLISSCSTHTRVIWLTAFVEQNNDKNVGKLFESALYETAEEKQVTKIKQLVAFDIPSVLT